MIYDSEYISYASIDCFSYIDQNKFCMDLPPHAQFFLVFIYVMCENRNCQKKKLLCYTNCWQLLNNGFDCFFVLKNWIFWEIMWVIGFVIISTILVFFLDIFNYFSSFLIIFTIKSIKIKHSKHWSKFNELNGWILSIFRVISTT